MRANGHSRVSLVILAGAIIVLLGTAWDYWRSTKLEVPGAIPRRSSNLE